MMFSLSARKWADQLEGDHLGMRFYVSIWVGSLRLWSLKSSVLVITIWCILVTVDGLIVDKGHGRCHVNCQRVAPTGSLNLNSVSTTHLASYDRCSHCSHVIAGLCVWASPREKNTKNTSGFDGQSSRHLPIPPLVDGNGTFMIEQTIDTSRAVFETRSHPTLLYCENRRCIQQKTWTTQVVWKKTGDSNSDFVYFCFMFLIFLPYSFPGAFGLGSQLRRLRLSYRRLGARVTWTLRTLLAMVVGQKMCDLYWVMLDNLG